jgi:hypothetical protein
MRLLLPVNCIAKSRRYHSRMARLFILFLIALLPLRGWTAERMVFQMERGTAVSAQAHDLGNAVYGAMPADCALHMQMASVPHEDAASQTPDHKGCESCQLCMPLAALAAPAVLCIAANPQAQPATRSSRFVSADPARDVKPPIS